MEVDLNDRNYPPLFDVAVYFGPVKPANANANWIKTLPGKGLVPILLVLRADRGVLRQVMAIERYRTAEVTDFPASRTG